MRISPAAQIAAAMVLTGSTGTAQALGPDGSSPLSVGFLRMALGGPVLLLVAIVVTKKRPTFFGCPLLVAGVATAAYQPLFFAGAEQTGVAVGTVVTMGSAPIFAGLLGWLVYTEKLDFRWVLTTAVALFGGVLLVGGNGFSAMDYGGVAAAAGAGLSYAVFIVATRRLFQDHAPLLVVGAALSLSAVLLLPIGLMADYSWVASPAGLSVVLYLGLVATGLAFAIYSYGAERLLVADTAVMSLVEPMVAFLLGVLLLHEALTFQGAVGGVILAGALLALATQSGQRPGIEV